MVRLKVSDESQQVTQILNRAEVAAPREATDLDAQPEFDLADAQLSSCAKTLVIRR
jgi:hypothetical protein